MAAVRAGQEDFPATSRYSYDVFLSFRGIDTRFTFTDHLYTALVGAGWSTFRDEEEIDRGEEIELELKKAIPDSRCSVVVFSENYASSVWCLDELVMIMERRRTSNHVVIPVFYHVDPYIVRYQQGSFGKALATQEERFKARKRGSEDDWRERMKGWREALKNAAGLGGLDLKNQADRYESKFIQKIVEEVDGKLPHTHLSIPEYLVGIDYQLESISSWLKNGPSDVGIMSIWGTAGIGKTTIAKQVFDLNLGSFDAGSFLSNITKTSKESHGVLRLQKQLISEILMGKKRKIRSVDEGVWKIRQVMAGKKVLLVLDDVEEEDQVTEILGMQKWFCKGSKIVITTRNRKFINDHRDDKIHIVEVDTLLEAPSLKLFCMHAFGEEDPPENYRELTNRVLAHCGGLPMALRNLGRLLSRQSVYDWERTLEKLKTIPDWDIQKKLEINYNSLKSDFDKNLFLDIACFFVGKDKNLVVKILEERDFCPSRGIENLKDRGLLSVDKNNKLRMHQLHQQMGRELIRQKEPNELGKRCRLWHREDSLNVLKENTGTRAIRGLDLGMHMEGNLPNQHGSGYAFSNWNEVQLKTSSFTMMSELRLLLIYYVQLTGGYENFPSKLRWLCWHRFPMTSIPTDFPLESLVVIDMRNSHLTRFWNGTKVLRFLKILNLSHCRRLTETPDFSRLPNLEKLILKNCYGLLEVHESIGHLETRLVLLNLNGCKSLMKLPRAIGRLKVLETLIISGCSSLDHLPEEISKIVSLSKFLVDDINLGLLVPTPKEEGTLQEEATLQEESTLQEEATSQEAQIVYLQIRQASFPLHLTELSLVGCNLSDDAFSRIKFTNLFSLKTLDLSGNPISFLPDSIKSLTGLALLYLEYCRRLKRVETQSSIRRLDVHDCTALERISVGGPREKCRINSFGCEQLVEITNDFKLEPLENVDAETANHLQLYGLQSNFDREMTLYSTSTHTERKGPIQGLYMSDGVFSVFFPWCEVPRWFEIKSDGDSVSFVMPPNLKIHSLNVCSVYTMNKLAWDDTTDIGAEHIAYCNTGRDMTDHFRTVIRTKDMVVSHSPSFYGIPEPDEDMIWLSIWKCDNLKAGDEVNVSVHPDGVRFDVKEIGVHLVTYDEHEQMRCASTSTAPTQSGLSLNLWPVDEDDNPSTPSRKRARPTDGEQ